MPMFDTRNAILVKATVAKFAPKYAPFLRLGADEIFAGCKSHLHLLVSERDEGEAEAQ